MISSFPSEEDLYLFHEGTCYHSYRFLGAHLTQVGDSSGVTFAVWAPHASEVKVLGDFNGWTGERAQMTRYSMLILDMGRERWQMITGDIKNKVDRNGSLFTSVSWIGVFFMSTNCIIV